MKLLVTGASGFLGWNICQIAKKEWEVSGTVFSHNIGIPGVNILRVDLTDFKELKRLFQVIRPDAVIHAAAKSDPNYCQTHREETQKINVDSAISIASLCAGFLIPCVFTSTDLVFDGLNPPYREEAPVCPVNFYGEQKVLAEKGMFRHDSKYVYNLSYPLSQFHPFHHYPNLQQQAHPALFHNFGASLVKRTPVWRICRARYVSLQEYPFLFYQRIL